MGFFFFGTDAVDQPAAVQGNSNRRSVSTLKPCAKDAYMLFQVAGAHIFIYMQLTLGASTSLYEISRLCCRHMDNVLNQNLGLSYVIYSNW